MNSFWVTYVHEKCQEKATLDMKIEKNKNNRRKFALHMCDKEISVLMRF
jgi:hypothetical protein